MNGRTLSDTELAACRPIQGEGGQALRAFCPFHGSDQQRSLRVRLDTGRFSCFACGAWGYTEEARQRWQAERRYRSAGLEFLGSLRMRQDCGERGRSSSIPFSAPGPPQQPEPLSARRALTHHLTAFQAALPGSRGEAYLRQRGIPLALAQSAGVGYAAKGTWPHTVRDWRWGRLVVPHTNPDGEVVNLYGRAVGTTSVPKGLRHDHLPGAKGYFNAAALRTGEGPLFVCEGVFDALSLMAAGHSRVVAIFGVHDWRWEWVRTIRELVLALDADATGQQHWREIARQAGLRGKRVAILPPEAYGGHKDINDAWVAGILTVGDWPGTPEVALPEGLRELWEERAAIMEYDGRLLRPAAEDDALACLREYTNGSSNA
jgi:hypothetical protein